MAREENLLILKMLQDGTISAEQAAELLNAMDVSESRAATTPPIPPVPAAAPAPPVPPIAPVPSDPPVAELMADVEGEAFTRARARIAAARERVAGVQERLSAAEERLEKAATSPNPWEQMADVFKDLPGAKSVTDALRGIDPGKIASGARRQARRMAHAVRSSIGDLDLDLHVGLAEQMHGEPIFSSPREATAGIPSGGTLRVRNTLGDIEAQGADVPEARIAGVLKVWGADRAAAETLAGEISIVVEHGSDGPTVSVRHPEKLRRVSLDLKVFVPQEGVKLSLSSLQGDIAASGLKGAVVLASQSGDARASLITGDVAAETASGDVLLDGVAGNITVSSASGDIQGIRLSGQSFRAATQSGDVTVADSDVAAFNIQTVSGDAEAKRVVGRTMRVRAVSGDVTVSGSEFAEETHLDTVSGYVVIKPSALPASGAISLATVSGDASVTLPPQAGASLEMSTKSGDIRAQFAGPDGADKEIKVSGMVRVNETVGKAAGPKITISSVSGDLNATQDKAEPA